MIEKMNPNYIYTWHSLELDAMNLADKIGRGKYKYILAVSKAWLVPAYYLAKHLWIEVVVSMSLSNVVFERTWLKWPTVKHSFEWATSEIKTPQDWLLVDAISDTWMTLEYLKKEHKFIKTVVFIQKKTAWMKADYFGREVENVRIELPYNK